MTPIRILELRSVRGTGGGPEKTILRGTARTDPRRFAITVCYIRDLRDPVFEIDKKAGALPIEYVELRERHSYDPSIWPALRRIVADRNIDIVHAHDYKTNFLAAMLRRFTGVQAMSAGQANNGWRLVPVSGNANEKKFASREYAIDRTLRPKLVAQYTVP